jgi:hypothetical protein
VQPVGSSILHHDQRAKARKRGVRVLCVPRKCRVGIAVQSGPQVSPHPAIHRRLYGVVWAVPQKAIFEREFGGEGCQVVLHSQHLGKQALEALQGPRASSSGTQAGKRRQGQSCATKVRRWSANHACADSVARGNAGRVDAPPDRSGKTRRTTGDHAR